ncbi:hypothetical protein Tco_0073759 [Tanacetum coccineum]
MEEIYLFLASDESIPPGIDSDYSDSEGEKIFLERLLHDDPTPLLDISSPTHVTFPFEDHHDLDFTCVVRVFLPFFPYPVTSSFLLSSESEGTIFDLGISTFHFSSLKSVAYENPIVIFYSYVSAPKTKEFGKRFHKIMKTRACFYPQYGVFDLLLILESHSAHVQRIESKAKTVFRVTFDDVFTFIEVQTKSLIFLDHTIGKSTKLRVQRRVISPPRHVSSHVSCHVLPRGTTWLPRGSGGHHLTRPLTGGQPPLTGGPAVVDRWSGGGPVVVDGGPPPLTVVGHR